MLSNEGNSGASCIDADKLIFLLNFNLDEIFFGLIFINNKAK